MSNSKIEYAYITPTWCTTVAEYTKLHSTKDDRLNIAKNNQEGFALQCPVGHPLNYISEYTKTDGQVVMAHFRHNNHVENGCVYAEKYPGGEGAVHLAAKERFADAKFANNLKLERLCGSGSCWSVVDTIEIDPAWVCCLEYGLSSDVCYGCYGLSYQKSEFEKMKGHPMKWLMDVVFTDANGIVKLVVEVKDTHATIGEKRDWLRGNRTFKYVEVDAESVNRSEDGRVVGIDFRGTPSTCLTCKPMLDQYVRRKLGQQDDRLIEFEGQKRLQHRRIEFHAESDAEIQNNKKICELFKDDLSSEEYLVINFYKGAGYLMGVCGEDLAKHNYFGSQRGADVESFPHEWIFTADNPHEWLFTGDGTVDYLTKALNAHGRYKWTTGDDDDYCVTCNNSGQMYYWNDCYGDCLECNRGDSRPLHPFVR